MNRLLALLTVTVAGAAVCAVLATSAGAFVRSCPTPAGFFNFHNSQGLLGDLSVRNMTCTRAIRVLHRASVIGWPPNLRAAGFRCYRLNGGPGGGTVRCVHGRPYTAFRVSIGT